MTSEPHQAAEPVRVLVVDDAVKVRDGLARLLGRLGGIEVAGVASGGREAVELAGSVLPHVVLMDLRMPDLDGVEATRRIVARYPGVAVLILSAYGDESLVIEALIAGARGYLLKGAPALELAEAVTGAAAGQSRLAGQVTRPVLEKLVEILGRERETRRAAEEARNASETVRRRQQQFATGAMHELRTPVTALLGSLTTLERLCPPERLEPPEQELLAACTRQTRRLARLVEDLMVVAEEAGGGLSVSLGAVDVERTIAGVVADLDDLGARRVRVTAAAGLLALADPDRLAQVLGNLVRNALQHSPPGAPVEVAAHAGPGVVRVEVAHRGPGIPPEKVPELFDRFGERASGQVGGLGVGLWVVRELLTAMRGDVWVEHDPAGGGATTFCVAVPAVWRD